MTTTLTWQPPAANAKIYVRSTLLFIGIIGACLLFAPLILLQYPLPFTYRYQTSIIWIRFILAWARITCGVRYHIEGLQHLNGLDTAIVLCKHQSAWETIALRTFLPRQTALLKRSLLWLPIWGWALATLKPIAIERKNKLSALRALLRKGKAALQEGLWVVVFPEGTRVAPGTMGTFNNGGAILAHKTGIPVLPIAHNAGYCWPRYSFLKYPGLIQVRIGPPISSKDKTPDQINQEAKAWICQAMTELEPHPTQRNNSKQ
ncbi:MAG: lysophospholipid acyltransferase family protein [Methylococcales bacterium]|nr:lysophospholipid acyltransferase family protein [Methylococcales bacterium]